MIVLQCPSSRCEVALQILPALTAQDATRIGFAIAGVWVVAWGIRLIARQISGS